MKVANQQLNDVVESAEFKPMQYCAVVITADNDETRTEIRWARGSKSVHSESIK